MQSKTRTVIYHYGPDAAADAKDRAVELRAKGGNARTIDAENFADVEQTDEIEFVGNFPPHLKQTIETAYEGFDKRVFGREASEHNEDGSPAIDIPEQWTQMSFPEMQKLAAALSDQAVRSKEAAMEIILAEIERRQEKMRADGLLGNEGDDDGDDLDKMTKAQLADYADEHDIDLGEATKKADMLEAIRAAQKE